MTGVPEGSLLGVFKENAKAKTHGHICLTGDDKKAIKAKKSTEEVLREQRDQAHREITSLNHQIGILSRIVQDQEEELKALKTTSRFGRLWKSLRKKLSDWIAP